MIEKTDFKKHTNRYDVHMIKPTAMEMYMGCESEDDESKLNVEQEHRKLSLHHIEHYGTSKMSDLQIVLVLADTYAKYDNEGERNRSLDFKNVDNEKKAKEIYSKVINMLKSDM